MRATLLLLLSLAAHARVADDDDPPLPAYLRRNASCNATKDEVATLPQTVHHIWWQGEAALPEHFVALRRGWSKHNPSGIFSRGWAHKLWDAEAIGRLVNSSYGWFAKTFHALPSKIQKADAARYLILHSEGGLYVDVDIECLHAFDDLRADEPSAPLLFFEEPPPHWQVHGTVVSNGMLWAPKGHPLLKRLLKAVRPVPAVFASTGSKMVQAELQKCADGAKGCGCYKTLSSERFFPLHDGLRRASEFDTVDEHLAATQSLIADVAARRWPAADAFRVQFWTGSWIDGEMGRLVVDGVHAARAGDTAAAEALLKPTVWSKWGTRYKYHRWGAPHDAAVGTAKAVGAFWTAVKLRPSYGFAHYELGNVAMEAGRHEEASELFRTASSLRPSSELFTNNLGVTRLKEGKLEEAADAFRATLRLLEDGFAAVQGGAPEAQARLNLGITLHMTPERTAEAHAELRAVFGASDLQYEQAAMAAQRLKLSGGALPDDDELELTFADALFRAGRTREAAVHFAAAHTAATSDGVRARVADGMRTLADHWDDDEAMLTDTPKAPAKGRGAGRGAGRGTAQAAPPLELRQVGADGSTRVLDASVEENLPPEVAEQLRKVRGGS